MLSRDSIVHCFGAQRVVYRLVKTPNPIQCPMDHFEIPSNDKVESIPDARDCHVHCPHESPDHALQRYLIDLDNLSLPLLIIHFSPIDTI